MRILFFIGTAFICLGIGWAVADKFEYEYQRGYQDAINGLSSRQIDNVCIKWWFESDLKAAKKRICTK